MALSKQISRPIPYSDTHWKVPVWPSMGNQKIHILIECAARATKADYVECIANSTLTKTDVSVKLSVLSIHQGKADSVFQNHLFRSGIRKIKFFVFSDRAEADAFATEIEQLRLMEILGGTF